MTSLQFKIIFSKLSDKVVDGDLDGIEALTESLDRDELWFAKECFEQLASATANAFEARDV